MSSALRLFGFELRRTEKALSPVPAHRGWWRVIMEPFTGAWQRNLEEKRGDVYCYPTLYACLSRISEDVGKLPFVLREKVGGIWKEVENSAYSPVLRKPNQYQTAQQFRIAWVLSKLLQGNAYVLKRRDERGVVNAMYVLDPCRVQPMVSDSGAVYYQLQSDNLSTLPAGYPSENIVVPASEIIHDRCMTLHHWLIGIPPVAAAYWPALKNLKILKSSAEFFANNAQPGGILTAPAGMSEDDAKRVQSYWQDNYTGNNAGRIAVIGADMKFTSFAMKGADAQIVEQMRYSDEQICQPFGVPPFKVGIGSVPAGLGVDGINLLYHEDALSGHIEAMENLLDEALKLPSHLGVWLDTEPLLRMDEAKRAEVETKLVGGKIKTPDEGRARFGLGATGGGDTLWGQHQDYPLAVLAQRNDLNPVAAPAPSPAPEEEDESSGLAERAIAHEVTKNLEAVHAD